MSTPRLILASASPARARLLRGAGVAFEVVVSGVDETAAAPAGPVTTEATVAALAAAKAEAVAALCAARSELGAVVLGCDSLLDVDGTAFGKPAGPAAALALWKRLRGRSARLCTGHHLVEVATGRSAHAVGATTVHFATPDDAELEAYVARPEATTVAGGFTLDGLAAPFVTGVEGDPNTVIGLSLALLRTLLARLDVAVVDLWAPVGDPGSGPTGTAGEPAGVPAVAP